MTLGGRAAEELVFHEVTTGAANDIEKITHTAKQMVMRYGMSEKLGPRVLGRNTDMPFLGREMGHEPDYSDEIAREIDDEVRRIIEEGHELALKVLREHMDELHRISQILIERETIDKDQFERLLAGETEDAVFPTPRRRRAAARARAGGPSAVRAKPRPFPLPGIGDAAARARRRQLASRRQSGGELQAADRGALPAPVGDGRDQRHARLVLRRRRPSPRRGGDRGGARDARRRRGDRRRRRRVDPAGLGRRPARRGAAARRAGARGARRAQPVSIDTAKAEVARRALELGRRARQRRDGAARRSRARRRRRRGGRVRLPDAHARRAADDAGSTRVYDDVVSEVKAFLEERLGVRGRGGDPRGARLPRPGDRLREDGRAQPRARPPARRAGRARAAGRGRLLAQELARRSILGDPAGDGRHDRRRRSARRSPRSSAARRSSACTTSASTSRRCAVAQAVDGTVKIELRGLELFGHHGVARGGARARPAVRLRRRARGRRAWARRPDRGRGRLPRGRGGGARGRRPAGSGCSRRSRRRSPTRSPSASRSSACRCACASRRCARPGSTLEFAAVTAEWARVPPSA